MKHKAGATGIDQQYQSLSQWLDALCTAVARRWRCAGQAVLTLPYSAVDSTSNSARSAPGRRGARATADAASEAEFS